MPSLEVIAMTLADARQAQAGGADSLELVSRLDVGGLTPDLVWVQAVRDAVACRLYVMVRPHASSFVYDAQDRAHIFATLQAARRIGVTGVVFGALNPDATLDTALMQEVAQAAGDLVVTMHRALDHTPVPAQALATLAGTVQRVLCSGGAADIWQGREQMRAWVQAYPRLSFVCAGGVTLANIATLAAVTGAQEMHVGGAARENGHVTAAATRRLKDILATLAP
jgi:copper homeostasis protein